MDLVPRDAQAVLRRLSYDLRRHAVRDVLRTSQTSNSETYTTKYLQVAILTTSFLNQLLNHYTSRRTGKLKLVMTVAVLRNW